jgi:hypothetical protein
MYSWVHDAAAAPTRCNHSHLRRHGWFHTHEVPPLSCSQTTRCVMHHASCIRMNHQDAPHWIALVDDGLSPTAPVVAVHCGTLSRLRTVSQVRHPRRLLLADVPHHPVRVVGLGQPEVTGDDEIQKQRGSTVACDDGRSVLTTTASPRVCEWLLVGFWVFKPRRSTQGERHLRRDSDSAHGCCLLCRTSASACLRRASRSRCSEATGQGRNLATAGPREQHRGPVQSGREQCPRCPTVSATAVPVSYV